MNFQCLILKFDQNYISVQYTVQLTGVRRAGVDIGDPSWELNLIPDPRSKSHNLTGHNWSSKTQSTFSGFKSRWAIPDNEIMIYCKLIWEKI